MRSQKTRDEWFAALEERERAGISKRALAQKLGVSSETIRYWSRRFKRERAEETGLAPARFLPVEVVSRPYASKSLASGPPCASGPETRLESPSENACAQGVIELALSSGLRFRFSVGTESSYVAELVSALG